MKEKLANELLGLEFDWLASDADGHVALFSTAGGGYAPKEYLRDTDAHDAAIEAILSSAASTSARFAPQLPPERKNTWRLIAERGLFAFDSDAHGGPYRKIAAPVTAVLIRSLPELVVAVASRIVLPCLRFANLHEISAELLKQS